MSVPALARACTSVCHAPYAKAACICDSDRAYVDTDTIIARRQSSIHSTIPFPQAQVLLSALPQPLYGNIASLHACHLLGRHSILVLQRRSMIPQNISRHVCLAHLKTYIVRSQPSKELSCRIVTSVRRHISATSTQPWLCQPSQLILTFFQVYPVRLHCLGRALFHWLMTRLRCLMKMQHFSSRPGNL